jgi:hypothetical protein
MHVPDMLETPGMIRVTRWANADSKQGQRRKYLPQYEQETDNVSEYDKKVQEIGTRTVAHGCFSDLPVFDPPGYAPRLQAKITA